MRALPESCRSSRTAWHWTTARKRLQRSFLSQQVTAIADMKMGEAAATAWGCDLTYDYVKINADYRS